MSVIIIGIGNPIVSDDSVGIRAARLLEEKVACMPDIGVRELYCGGLRLMEEMAGYDKAIILDAMSTGENAPGTIKEYAVSDLGRTRNISSSHDTGLMEAVEAGRLAGIELPSAIRIIGIEAGDARTFGESLTPEVEEALHEVVGSIARELLKHNDGQGHG